jgi:hypothetical protein
MVRIIGLDKTTMVVARHAPPARERQALLNGLARLSRPAP